MVSIFDFVEYKKFVNQWVESLPSRGHGEFRRMALALNISTTMVSQVFRGNKQLSLEMAVELAEYLGLTDEECSYLLLLVEWDRAGSHKLKKKLGSQIDRARREARQLEKRLKKDTDLNDSEKAVFYSSWIYSAIRLLTDLDEYNDPQSLAERLHLPRSQVSAALEFLLQTGLVRREKGRLVLGASRTHIGSSNLLVTKHHQNWRLVGLQKMVGADDEQLFATFPMSMSKEVALEIRQELPTIIEKITKKVAPSKSEVVRCLNIDWFEI